MGSLTFDTLKFANRLKAAGVAPEHAEAEAEALADVFKTGTADLATKADLNELRNDLRTSMDVRFAKVEGELTLIKWMLGLLLAGVASMIAKTFF